MAALDPKREFAVEVVRRLHEAGHAALWAGGCVRDSLLGLEPEDYDVATDARPEQVQKLFGPRRTLAIGASFGVILVRGPRTAGNVEVATFRTEGPYLDGRRPEHVSYSSPEEDAKRRDFTINGMFYDPLTDTVLDFVGGREDLDRRIVRAIGEPHERIREDKLRMLRAVRIAARFDFELDPTTARAIGDMAGEILVVSQERIAQELKKMLVHPRRTKAVELARTLGLLAVILPELTPLSDFPPYPRGGGGGSAGTGDADSSSEPPPTPPRIRGGVHAWQKTLRMLDLLQQPRFELAVATLLHELAPLPTAPADSSGKSSDEAVRRAHEIGRRLRLSNHEIEHIAWLLAHRNAVRTAPQLARAPLKRLLVHPLIPDLLTLTHVALQAEDGDLSPVEFCETFLRDTPPHELNPPPLLTGDDLIRHGLQPGARFKELLDRIRDAQLEGTVRTREDALRLVDEVVDPNDDSAATSV